MKLFVRREISRNLRTKSMAYKTQAKKTEWGGKEGWEGDPFAPIQSEPRADDDDAPQ